MTATRKHSLLAIGVLAAVVTSAACTTVSDDTGSASSAFRPAGDGQRFLSAFWTDDENLAEPYNGQVFDSTPPAYPDDLASPKTLRAWKQKFMPSSEPVVSSLYRNVRELGGGPESVFFAPSYFWRQMTCTKRFVRGGPGGCFVTNTLTEHGIPTAHAPDNDGTVAMSLTRDGFVHFSLYEAVEVGSSGSSDPDGAGSNPLAALDDEAGKVAPHVCVNCHSGKVDVRQDLLLKPDLGSVFREFEPSLLEAPPGVSQAAAEQQWFELNQAVLAANAALRGESEGAIAGVEHARSAISAHIHDLYDGLGEPKSHAAPPFSRSVGAPELLPPSWRAQDADSQALWASVVNPYCMECHRHNRRDFSDFSNFAFLRDVSDGQSLLQQYVVDDGRRDNGLPYMPQAQAAFVGLQGDIGAWTAIRKWGGTPPSELVVEIAADQSAPNDVKLSADQLTATVPGVLAIRIVNQSANDASACYPYGDKGCEQGPVARIPGRRPGAAPSEILVPITLQGPPGSYRNPLTRLTIMLYSHGETVRGQHYIKVGATF